MPHTSLPLAATSWNGTSAGPASLVSRRPCPRAIEGKRPLYEGSYRLKAGSRSLSWRDTAFAGCVARSFEAYRSDLAALEGFDPFGELINTLPEFLNLLLGGRRDG